ncbi:MAG: MFS transporter [Aliidongia sp.]
MTRPIQASCHPVVFLFLLAPYGIVSGYVTVTLAYLLVQAGAGVAEIAALAAIGLLPQTWKVVWAPLVDTTLTRKRWYLIAALVTGSGIAVSGFVRPDAQGLERLTWLVFAFNVTASFQCMAAESLMANATPDDQKGRAGGWCQAGNLGGQGLGGGAGLWLASHLGGAWAGSLALGALCVLCCLALLFLDEPVAEMRRSRLRDDIRAVIGDVWSVMRARTGYLTFFLLLLPIGTGAAQNLWAALADDWHAAADTVALVNGAASGLVAAFGCLIGGYLCDHLPRRSAYLVFGVVLALTALAMALAPRTETAFIIFTSLYNFVIGFTYAASTAVALEAIGRGAAATKYNLNGQRRQCADCGLTCWTARPMTVGVPAGCC